MPIPTQFTSSGVGPAVLASQLGSSASYASPPAVSTTASPSLLSLTGPAVTPCSTCCNQCGRPSTTVINATMPTNTSLPLGSGTGSAGFPSYGTGIGSTTPTPPISLGVGSSLKTSTFSIISVAIVATMLFILPVD